jgi:hypothetical protein
MAKQFVKILIDGISPQSQWHRGGYPFDNAKSCRLCVTQHAVLKCEVRSHAALREAAKQLTESWPGVSPATEAQAQGILKLRRKFYRFFKTPKNEN